MCGGAWKLSSVWRNQEAKLRMYGGTWKLISCLYVGAWKLSYVWRSLEVKLRFVWSNLEAKLSYVWRNPEAKLRMYGGACKIRYVCMEEHGR